MKRSRLLASVLATGNLRYAYYPGQITQALNFTHPADFMFRIDVTAIPSGVGTMSMRLRQQDVNNRWQMTISQVGELVLYEVVAGAYNNRISSGSYGKTVAAGDRLEIYGYDNIITIRLNGAGLATYQAANNFKTSTTGQIGGSVLGSVWSDFEIYHYRIPPKRIAFLGDSITANGTGWRYYARHGIQNGVNYEYSHAVAGQSIIGHMDAQTLAAATDDADIIIVALGTNDDNAGDMNALQAEYAENLAELKVSNPRATIYAMNVLPKWTDNTGATPVAKDNIRTAIAAACTAQGVTCWDTYTTPWITAADTTDGIHPNGSGAAKIGAQVLARL